MKKNMSKKRNESLSRKILIVLVAGVLFMGAAIVTTVVAITSSQLNNYFRDQLSEKYETFTEDLNDRQSKLQNLLTKFASDEDCISVIENGSKSEIVDCISMERTAASVNSIYITTEDGALLYASEGSIQKTDQLRNNSTFETAKMSDSAKGFLIVNPRVSIIAVRKLSIKKDGEQLYGVFEDCLTDYGVIDYYHKMLGCAFSIFIDDMCVATSVRNESGERLINTALRNNEIYDTVYSQHSKYYGTNIIQGEKYFSIYSPIIVSGSEGKGIFFIGQPVSLVKKMNYQLLSKTIPAVIVLCVLFVTIVLVLIFFLVMIPIKRAATAASSLARDTVDADLTYRINIKSTDEIGLLCKDIDVFLERLQNLIIDLKSAESSLEEIGQNLSTSSQESASATSEIMANIQGVRRQTTLQMQSVETANGEMGNVLSQTNQLDSLIENQSAGITESSASIEEMIGNISSVTESVRKMSEQFNQLIQVTKASGDRQADVDKKVQNMAEQSKLLSEANKVIAKIASQTNLLAMNAAIEAAHAGSAGAGFSVVADEIRSLAETSSKQSHAIGEELKQISSTMESVVVSSSESKESFGLITEKLSDTSSLVEEIDRAMTEQNNASQQTLEALKDINNSTSQVSVTAKTMKESTEKVQSEMNKVTELMQTVSGSMDEMSAGAIQINKAAQGVSDMAEKTKEDISGMDQLIGRFKV